MIHWVWLIAAAGASFIFGGIVGCTVACIPFSKALRRARESEVSRPEIAKRIRRGEKNKE